MTGNCEHQNLTRGPREGLVYKSVGIPQTPRNQVSEWRVVKESEG